MCYKAVNCVANILNLKIQCGVIVLLGLLTSPPIRSFFGFVETGQIMRNSS